MDYPKKAMKMSGGRGRCRHVSSVEIGMVIKAVTLKGQNPEIIKTLWVYWGFCLIRQLQRGTVAG
jgi:hypothetical protein